MRTGESLPQTDKTREGALPSPRTFTTEIAPDTSTVVYAGNALKAKLEADQKWLAAHPTNSQAQPRNAESVA
ncbi:MAG TPA: hypothetical protein VFL85_00600 [Candidatus Saccharimonadales bacterium]|nr:hypothetical protein [Candidatus Saccharimonadales bacterium]